MVPDRGGSSEKRAQKMPGGATVQDLRPLFEKILVATIAPKAMEHRKSNPLGRPHGTDCIMEKVCVTSSNDESGIVLPKFDEIGSEGPGGKGRNARVPTSTAINCSVP
jgi:hypothetical protein